MQAVHNAISPRAQKGRALKNIRQDVKELFPGLIHGKHGVGCIPVEKKGLSKKTQIPMGKKENENGHLFLI
jgi:hypothetical protein